MAYSVDEFSGAHSGVYDALSPSEIADAQRRDSELLAPHADLVSLRNAQLWLSRGSDFGLWVRSVFGPIGR